MGGGVESGAGVFCFVGLYDFSLGHGKLVKDDEKSRTLIALQQSCHAPARPGFLGLIGF